MYRLPRFGDIRSTPKEEQRLLSSLHPLNGKNTRRKSHACDSYRGLLCFLSGQYWFGATVADPSILGSRLHETSPMAAPPQIIKEATIVRLVNGSMQTLKKGTSQWTCMVAPDNSPMCMDPNAMEWAEAWQKHVPPPDKLGFMYMLAGDTGASNTDPFYTQKTADNHWIQTGSHVMIVGGGAKTMIANYPRSADPDPTKPYVMWPGTPYEHLMIPVK